MIPHCPTSAQLQSWLGDGHSTGIDDEISWHVTDCRTCQAQLDHLSDDPELRCWADRIATMVDDQSTLPSGFDSLPPNYYLPSHIGQYRIERELGRGGMGVVYLAHDVILNRPVALKLIRRDALKPETRERFLREVRSVAKIQHEHVVGVYASGESDADGSPFLAMEYISGPTLAEMIHTQNRLLPKPAAELAVQIADGLAAAHEAGLVHRDVKPANVLIHKSSICKLADFGMVRDDSESALTSPSVIAGTPAYLSPEQARGEPVDARCDIYSLGITLYEMLTGEPPFRGPPHQVLRQILDDEPRPPRQIDTGISIDLETIVLKSVAKEPGRRYPSADEFAADLRRWLNNEPILARPVSRFERGRCWCRRNPRLALMTGLTAAALLALAMGGITSAILIGRAYDRAEIARNQAEGNHELAVKSYITLVDGVQKQMGNQPGLLPLKRKLLETAAEGLKRVIGDATNSTKTDETIFMAHLRLGNVLLELGRTSEGKTEIETALHHGEAWVARSPDDIKALRAVASPADRLGDLARYANQPETAREWYAKASECRTRIAAINPADPLALRDLSVSQDKIGDIDGEAGRWLSALRHFEEALRITEQGAADANRTLWLADMRFCRNRLSDACMELGDFESADQQARVALEHARELTALDRNAGRNEKAYALDRLARVAARRFDAKRAIDLRKESLALRREIATADPGNVTAFRNIGYALHYLGGAYGADGDCAAARGAFAEAIQIFGDSVRDDPDSAQWSLNLKIAFESAIENEENDGQYAAAARYSQDFIAMCRRCETNSQLASLKLNARRIDAERDLAAYQFAVANGLMDAAAFSMQPDEVRRKLHRLRVRDFARHDQADAALALLDLETSAEDAILAARVLAKSHRSAKAVAALRVAVRLKPEIADDFHLMAELYVLRDMPEFQAFRAELFARARR